jgi:hypothetical protein
MTAFELINKLKQYPGDMQVVVAGYENGFDDIETIKNVLLGLRPDKEEWDGKYEKSTEKNANNALALLGDRGPYKPEIF